MTHQRPSRTARLAAMLSLVLCVVVLALWASSYFTSIALILRPHVSLYTDRGQVVLMHTDPLFNFQPETPGLYWRPPSDPNDRWTPRRFTDRSYRVGVGHLETFPGLWLIVVNLWALLGPAAVPGLVVLWQRRRHKRRVATRHCAECGYDLRASPGGCPECGAGR